VFNGGADPAALLALVDKPAIADPAAGVLGKLEQVRDAFGA
jgi:hypothetical protein